MIAVIIQAREKSSRFPKKIFKKIIHGYTGHEDNVDVISLQDIENQKE